MKHDCRANRVSVAESPRKEGDRQYGGKLCPHGPFDNTARTGKEPTDGKTASPAIRGRSAYDRPLPPDLLRKPHSANAAERL
jgi:hypothetical protein